MLTYPKSAISAAPKVSAGTSCKSVADLWNDVGRIKVLSTDVFDTLLLRNSVSERSRIVQGERLFSKAIAHAGWRIDADLLVEARLRAQRLAFRALNSWGGPHGEVRLIEIINRQLTVLGLPASLAAERVRIELQVEKGSLIANEQVARILLAHRRTGTRVVAITDTTLSGRDVHELIQHFHGADLIDHVYSSADCRLTKREGSLFVAVAQAENVPLCDMVHVGDDPLADLQVPSTKGVTALHAPRPAYSRYLRSANGALTETYRFARSEMRATNLASPFSGDATSFGREILGPIVAQFCLMIWLYVVEAEQDHEPCLLFCARGGIGIREAFERIVMRLSLPLKVRRENIMISRLIAARSALLTRSRSALEELDREFRGDAFADVAMALGGSTYELSEEWQKPFRANSFLTLLNGSSGTRVLADIKQQNALFTRHFTQLTSGSDRVILCDTGLYGSTHRLLASGFPDVNLETLLFARSNYKGHGEEHFPRVTGLMVEQNLYGPLNVYSCVLRYWHLIESLFEPATPSVRFFAEDEQGEIRANCGDIRFGAIDLSALNLLLLGVLAYIDSLPKGGGAVVLRDAEVSWRRLKQAITRPTEAELRCLEVTGRSVDFGRPDVLRIFDVPANGLFLQKMMSLKAQLWREGAIAREFPFLKHALWPTLETAHFLRWLLARQH